MKNIIFYLNVENSFGRTYQDLAKYLFLHGFNCHILSLNKNYSVEEMKEIEGKVDMFVTSFDGWRRLKSYGVISNEKCIVVAHSKRDVSNFIITNGTEEFENIKKFVCISNNLIRSSKELNVKRTPTLVKLGVDYGAYCQNIKEKLLCVGFGGDYCDSENGLMPRLLDLQNDEGFKENNSSVPINAKLNRGWLVKKAVESAGLKLKIARNYCNSHVTTPGFYGSIDALICANVEEDSGMPFLESAAAGNLIITTNSGYVQEETQFFPIHVVPAGEENFLRETIRILLDYKNDNAKYRKRCEEIREYAKKNDWSNCIDQWIELLS